jgi:N-acetylmuramoyl-L-alanine amidase
MLLRICRTIGSHWTGVAVIAVLAAALASAPLTPAVAQDTPSPNPSSTPTPKLGAILTDKPDANIRQKPRATAAATRPACRKAAFKIVIDVGHTAEVPGATSARGVPEYAFNLALADEIVRQLQAAGFDKTVRLITATPPLEGLVERARKANGMHADLFVAIHHDSVPDQFLETWQFEGQENHFSDRFHGFAIFISADNADRAGSLAFGSLLGRALEAHGLHYTPHYTLPIMGNRRRLLVDAKAGVYRYDQLIVLRETKMPAVLLEAGSIINRAEELELATAERRAITAGALTAAATEFCAGRTSHPGEYRPSSAVSPLSAPQKHSSAGE